MNLFEFDYDLTFMVFFLDANAKVYARYGGRDARDADNRQSLEGLHYTMKSVLAMHQRTAAEREYAPKSAEEPRFLRGAGGMAGLGGFGGKGGRCMHCHQIRESLNSSLRRNGDWSRDMIYRYPLPENIGMHLEVDRGNVVKLVKEASPAAKAGCQPGDILRRLNGVPIHSFGDAQYALDRAPVEGTVAAEWQRGNEIISASLDLTAGWRRTDLSWRASMRRQLASARLVGQDLSSTEKESLGLKPRQLAFRQRDYVHPQAQAAGVKPGDIILGFDDLAPEMDVATFLYHVHNSYLIGERVSVHLLRDGKRMTLPMTLMR